MQFLSLAFIRSIQLNISSTTTIVFHMANWENEKTKYLNMNTEEKRNIYSKYETVNDILTWKEYAKKEKLRDIISMLNANKIDPTKNERLADKISLFRGDITTLEIDCIVNAANSRLTGGGGVDGAIHRAAGPNLTKECVTLRGCNVGEAKITGGYKLPAKYVIHTVGPQGEKPTFLSQCYQNSLNLMLKNKLKTVAFPCISTGVYNYPNEPAAHVAVHEVRKFLEENESIDRVIFCVFLDRDLNVYQGILQSYFPIV